MPTTANMNRPIAGKTSTKRLTKQNALSISLVTEQMTIFSHDEATIHITLSVGLTITSYTFGCISHCFVPLL